MRVMAAYHSISVVCYLGVIMNVDVLPVYTNQLLEFSASLMENYSRGKVKTPFLTIII
ncbi:unnamed protein product, partial [Allacma fusca]